MKSSKIRVFPLKIYISTQNGRQYLMGYYYRELRPAMYRIDNIAKIRTIGFEKNHQLYDFVWREVWGTYVGSFFRKKRQQNFRTFENDNKHRGR